MRPRSASALATLLVALATAAGAGEAPRGIVAFVGTAEESGGNALIIGQDGLAVTLTEALPAQDGPYPVVLPGGSRRSATVVRRDAASGAVLLRIADLPPSVTPIALADSGSVQPFDPVWTVGNAAGMLENDGAPALSRGVVSGLYELPAGGPPVRGRGGRILAAWNGPAIETDAAINDGSHGGALIDASGRLVGLASRAQARERRLPVAVPLARILAGLGLPPATQPAAGGGESWRSAATRVAPSLALVYLERPAGPGNPEGVPRPPRTLDEAAAGERDRLARWWDMHWHQQQVFYTDQPVSALSLGGDLLLTAASNLHGGAERGRVLLPDGAIACTVIGRDLPLDLALLRCERAHGLPAPEFAGTEPALGQPVALLGRHRADAGWTGTLGSISATERRREQSRLAFLQTDARANYGSLGGPLIDSAGRVVGLAVLLGPHERRPWLINSGVAMAIDAARIRDSVASLREGRSFEAPPMILLGVNFRFRSGRLVVERLIPGLGAEAAGIQPGDELLAVAGVRVASIDTVTRLIMRRKPGDTVAVTLRRGGEEIVAQVVLQESRP
jgi:S1-C subfamily serine protease